jgi:hypothetical protein
VSKHTGLIYYAALTVVKTQFPRVCSHRTQDTTPLFSAPTTRLPF